MTDFIPFGTPPGSTGNPKQLPGDVFSAGDVIKCSVTGTVSGVTPVVVSDTATVVAPTTIGTVTVTGSTTPETGTEETYTVTFTGDAADATYSWSVSPATATIDVNTGTNTAGITFDADDTYTVTVTVTSATATDSPVDGSLASIVSTTPSSEDWFSNELGAGTVANLSTSNTSLVYDAAYPVDGTQPTGLRTLAAVDPSATGSDKNPISQFVGSSTAANFAGFVGVYVPAAICGSNFQQNHQPGWYVFGGSTYNSGSSAQSWETPIAWPTITTSGSANDRGFLESGSSTGAGIWFCFWDTLPAGIGSGEGGTDHWTDPNA